MNHFRCGSAAEEEKCLSQHFFLFIFFHFNLFDAGFGKCSNS
jgi:hypothetical protein